MANPWRSLPAIKTMCCLIWLAGPAFAEPVKHQVTGLFMPDRQQDLRDAVAKIPDVRLVRIDYKYAEVVFDYDLKKFGKPEQASQKLDNLLKSASGHTFGIKPLCTLPKEKLKLIEIPVAGLDCKACSLAAYESIFRVDGVERATASFREGRVTALVDPAKVDRTRLEDALKKKGVRVGAP